jgi:hypothetical protein
VKITFQYYRSKTLCNCSFEAYFELRSRFPEIVGNIKNAEQRMEDLEGANAPAKQMLSRDIHGNN